MPSPSVPNAAAVQKANSVVVVEVAPGEGSAAMSARERSTLGVKGLRPACVRAQFSFILCTPFNSLVV